MPRAFSSVGWAFETIHTDPNMRYNLSAWSEFTGYLTGIIFLFIKTTALIVSELGPFSMFINWLFIMFGFTVALNAGKLIMNTLYTVVDIIIRAIDILWP